MTTFHDQEEIHASVNTSQNRTCLFKQLKCLMTGLYCNLLEHPTVIHTYYCQVRPLLFCTFVQYFFLPRDKTLYFSLLNFSLEFSSIYIFFSTSKVIFQKFLSKEILVPLKIIIILKHLHSDGKEHLLIHIFCKMFPENIFFLVWDEECSSDEQF